MKKKLNIDFIISLVITLILIVFILYPFLKVLKESFFVDGIFSMDNYKEVIKDKKLILNTFKMGILSAIIATVFAVIVSIFQFLQNQKIKKILSIVFAICIISPPFVSGLSYISLFGRRGLISYGLLGLHIDPYGMWGIVLMQALSDLALNVLILNGFLKNINRDIINASRSLKATTTNIIIDIIIPIIKNGIIAVFVISFFRSVSDFSTPAIIGGNFKVLALESYFEVIAKGNLNKASAMNVFILVPTLVLFLLSRNIVRNKNQEKIYNGDVNIKRSGILYYLISLFAIILIAFLIVIYISIIIGAFSKKSAGNLIFSLDNFKDTKYFIKDVSLRSIGYAVVASLVASFLGLLVSYLTAIKKIRMMKFSDLLSNLPYIIPGTFFGLGYLLAFRSGILAMTGTFIIVILNMLFKQMPFTTRIFNASMNDIDKNVLNSIRDLGGRGIHEIKDGIVPMNLESLKISLINTFNASMTTVGSIIFLIYPQRKVLTMVMFDVINSAKYNVGSVIAFEIIILCLLFNLLVQIIFNRLIRR
ncbi:MAG: ABC transporter permease subunit [Tissierellia bacterium]|nr:ABC transporter permease subunit [Tissierellia bacterium]